MTCVLDDGADINVISQSLALKYGLRKISTPLPDVSNFEGTEAHCYGAYAVRLCLADSTGVERTTTSVFFATDLREPEMLLGRPWRRQHSIIADARNDQWWYAEEDELPAVRPREACDFARDIKKAKTVFAVQVSLPATQPLPDEIADFVDVILDGDVGTRPLPEGVEHAIDLLPSGKPPFRPLYNLSVKELEILRQYLEQALANGWIQHSASEAGAPILFVPKKDGTLRMCVDYRGLNAITVKNRHALPLIGETLDRLGRSAWFSALDLKDAYHRIPIKRGDEWKTAFRTRYGHFEYKVMPFGLTNAPATFQAYINKALAGLVDDICVVYLDDILIYSLTREEHARHLRLVLERLRKYALYASRKKCRFFTNETEYLGYVINGAGVAMDKSRVATIEEWPVPKDLKEVQTFLGFANFYRRFIRGYSKIVGPLTSLTKGAVNGKKPGPIEWGAAQEQAFRTVKAAFTQAPILRHYRPEAKLRMETDASNFAISAILSQLLVEGDEPAQWYPIAFWSRKLNPAEQNYETHDGELLAIVEGFKQYRHYLEGASHAVQVLTDHNNLRGFMGVKQLNGRQARWATFLAAFDFVIEHRSGRTNPADAPSRRPDYEGVSPALSHLLPTLQKKLAVWEADPDLAPIVGRVRAYEECTPRWLEVGDPLEKYGGDVMIRAVVKKAGLDENPYGTEPVEDLASLIRKLQERDDELQGLRERSAGGKPAGATNGSKPGWVQANGLWYFGDRLYVPSDGAVQAEIMRIHHDDPLAGHFGREKTELLIKRKYWWPGLSKDVEEYCSTCTICEVMKPRRHRPYGEAQALPMPGRAWQEITMDFITDLPPCKVGNEVMDAVLVIVDRYSKMVVYVPTTKRCTSVELASILMEWVVRRYGMPRGIVSDRGTVFTSQYWSSFAFEAQVKLRLSTAFHPQTDGQTERANQTLEQYLRCYCSEEQENWASHLAMAEFAVNNSVHQALRMSPFCVLYGWNPEVRNAPTRDEFPEGRVPAAAERAREVHEASEQLAKRWAQAQAAQVKNNNLRHVPREFKVGDMVLLSTKNLRLPVPKKKLAARFVGPFRVRDAVGKQAYRLSLPTAYKIHNVFHVSLLEPWKGRKGEEPALPMPLAVEEDEWEVEKIVDSKLQAGQRWYLVAWAGWPEEYTSWEPEEHCRGAEEKVAEWWAQAERRSKGKGKVQ